MILFLDNEIDNKIAQTFSKEILENIIPQNTEYLGINIDTNIENDFVFKIYYHDKYSRTKFEKHNDDPIINFLAQNDMLENIEVVNDKQNTDLTRYNMNIGNRYNEHMEKFFECLEKNVSFFKKYKDEIITLAKMKHKRDKNFKYSSLYFVGYVKEDSEIKTLKCYFLNKIITGSSQWRKGYYFKYIKDHNIKGFDEIIPYARTVLKYCRRKLLMEAVDYNENFAEKHKIYIVKPKNLYEALLKTFFNDKELYKKICKTRDWHKLHPEFFCEGFGIGKDHNNNIVLNLYYKFHSENE